MKIDFMVHAEEHKMLDVDVRHQLPEGTMGIVS